MNVMKNKNNEIRLQFTGLFGMFSNFISLLFSSQISPRARTIKVKKPKIEKRKNSYRIGERTHSFDHSIHSMPHYHRYFSHFWHKLFVRRHQSFSHYYYHLVRYSAAWTPPVHNVQHNYFDRRALHRIASNSRDMHSYRSCCGVDSIAGRSVWPAIVRLHHRRRRRSSCTGQRSDFYFWPTTSARSLPVSMIWNVFSTTTACFFWPQERFRFKCHTPISRTGYP